MSHSHTITVTPNGFTREKIINPARRRSLFENDRTGDVEINRLRCTPRPLLFYQGHQDHIRTDVQPFRKSLMPPP